MVNDNLPPIGNQTFDLSTAVYDIGLCASSGFLSLCRHVEVELKAKTELKSHRLVRYRNHVGVEVIGAAVETGACTRPLHPETPDCGLTVGCSVGGGTVVSLDRWSQGQTLILFQRNSPVQHLKKLQWHCSQAGHKPQWLWKGTQLSSGRKKDSAKLYLVSLPTDDSHWQRN